ncbi:hypothetical protein DESC_380006 [Desulfosarcina cetonica]|nr:hypothetical protein DESC_380006 [Desulfosarcina cetonica]
MICRKHFYRNGINGENLTAKGLELAIGRESNGIGGKDINTDGLLWRVREGAFYPLHGPSSLF